MIIKERKGEKIKKKIGEANGNEGFIIYKSLTITFYFNYYLVAKKFQESFKNLKKT